MNFHAAIFKSVCITGIVLNGMKFCKTSGRKHCRMDAHLHECFGNLGCTVRGKFPIGWVTLVMNGPVVRVPVFQPSGGDDS